MSASKPLNLLPELRELNDLFIELIKDLKPEEWQRPTIAGAWVVKDVVAHLLDGNIRILSMLRDGYYGESPSSESYEGLVAYINRLNADWVQVMRRVSPTMLILLHELTGPLYHDYYASLDPQAEATFAVAWAGEETSKNWMHVAREYTEKFLHQQQIRAATRRPGLMTSKHFRPFAEVCLKALPHTFRDVRAAEGTCVRVVIPGDSGREWYLQRQSEGWRLVDYTAESPRATVVIPADAFWQLVSKSKRLKDLADEITISGDRAMGEKMASVVSFMA